MATVRDISERKRSEEALRTSEANLSEAQRIAQVGSWNWQVGADTVTWSAGLYRIYGLDPGAGPARFADYLGHVHPEDRDRVGAAVRSTVESLRPYEHEYRVALPDGRTRWVHARGEVVARREGAAERLAGYCQDITARREAEERRERAQRDLAGQQHVLERIARGDGLEETLTLICTDIEQRYPGARCSILLVDKVKRVLHHAAGPSLPDAFCQAIDGLPVAVGMGACGTAAARKEVVVVTDIVTDPLTDAFLALAAANGLRAVWSHPLTSGGGEVLGTFAPYRAHPHQPDESEVQTVTTTGSLAALAIERSLSEEALTAAAKVDPLTGLPNRTWFLEQLTQRLGEPGSRVAVMFFDLDRFKWINDSLGHPVGDRILVQIADRLGRLTDEGHIVARFGGDEFTLLIDDATEAKAVAVARQIESMLAEPFVLDRGEFFLSASIGLALNDHPADAHGLVRDADAAMFAAKERGRARHAMFDEGLRERALTRLTLESELRRALAGDEFVMHYQPILDLRSRQWAGEALVRWQHPDRGTISPDQFIPLAEETGLIVALGLRILDKVVTEAAGWASRGTNIYFAANASVVQLSDPAFAFEVAALLRRRALPPDRLVLEVTETAVMQRLDTAQAALKRITALGVRWSLTTSGPATRRWRGWGNFLSPGSRSTSGSREPWAARPVPRGWSGPSRTWPMHRTSGSSPRAWKQSWHA